MHPALRIINFIALAFFGYGVVAIALANPSTAVLAVLNLVPFGLALLAVRAGSSKAAVWAGVLVNGLWALLYVGIAVIVLAGLGGSVVAVPLALLVAIPCVLNAVALRRSLNAGAQPSYMDSLAKARD